MPLTLLQGIIAAFTAWGNHTGFRIVSVTPSNIACSFEGTGKASKEIIHIEHTIFGPGKWVRYQCDNGKGSKIEYEMIDPAKLRRKEGTRDMGIKSKRMRDRLRRAQEQRDRMQMQQKNWEERRRLT